MAYSNKDFIKAATAVHGAVYNYKNVVYKSAHAKVEIICRKHGAFLQTPANHIHRASGCSECMKVKLRKHFRDSRDTFLTKAKVVHGNKYSYAKVEYVNSRKHVVIVCVKCGNVFKQQPRAHLSGQGCNVCASLNKTGKYGKVPYTEFLDRARKIFGKKLSYKAPTNYRVCRDLIEVRCNVCKTEFSKSALDLSMGKGCRVCGGKSHSQISIRWLEYESKKRRIVIQHAENGGEFLIPGTRYRADGYNKRSNTIFEFHGDAYHGNPKRYTASSKPNPFSDKTAADLYKATKKREKEILALGYNLVVIWESEWRALQTKT